MQANEKELNLICNYGSTNLSKELLVTPQVIIVREGEAVLLNTPLSSISLAEFSANYVRLKTSGGSYVIRGIKPANYSLVYARKSLSDPKSLKEVRSLLENNGVKTKTNLFIADPKTIIVALSIIAITAVLLLIVR